jgi:osmotically-inducible protein OsmY
MTSTHHRSDAEIFSAARKVLDDHPSVPQVRVHVDSGIVTLTGSVRRPQEKAEAQAVVRRVDGVLGIVNRIMVAQAVDPEDFEAPESR